MPSAVLGTDGSSACMGSLYRFSRSLNSVSPTRVLPSFPEKALRPSSAVRASRLPVRKPIRSATACGSRIDRVDTGLDRLRLLRANGLAHRFVDDALRVELRQIEMVAGEIA